MNSERSSMHAGEAVVEALREEGVEEVSAFPDRTFIRSTMR